MIRSQILSQWRISLPTVITLLRIAFIPCIVTSMIDGSWGHACTFFSIASATDAIDGALARWWDDTTLLGAFLDPIADKLLILSCFFTLTFVRGPVFTIPLWFVLLVLCKELLLIGGIAVLYGMKKRVPIQPVFLGKCAMVVQTFFIIWLFACYFFHWMPVKTYYTTLGLVILTVFASLMHYSVLGFTSLCSKEA